MCLPVAVRVIERAAHEVVDVGIHADARLPREAQAEQAGAVVAVRAVGAAHVGEPAHTELLFELHVHGQGLCAHLFLGVAQRPVAVVHPFVDLDLVHRVGRQIFERHLGAAREEVLAVHEQALHPAAVHRDDPVFFQLHAGQHGDELVKHRALGQLERVGVVNERVPPHHHHQLRGLHGRLAELDAALGKPYHRDVVHVCRRQPVRVEAERFGHVLVEISFPGELHDERPRGVGLDQIRTIKMPPITFLKVCRNNRTICPHQCNPDGIDHFGSVSIYCVSPNRELLGM